MIALTAATPMAAVIIEPENLLRMMVSCCPELRYRDGSAQRPKSVASSLSCIERIGLRPCGAQEGSCCRIQRSVTCAQPTPGLPCRVRRQSYLAQRSLGEQPAIWQRSKTPTTTDIVDLCPRAG
jgi:hypothetical protein